MPFAADDNRSVNDELYDGMVQHDHFLLGVELYALYGWLNMFNRGVDEAAAILIVAGMGGGRLSDLPPEALRDALNRADVAIADAADRANDGFVDYLLGLFKHEATAVTRILRDVLPDNVSLASLTQRPRDFIYRLLNRTVGGKTLATRMKEMVAAARKALSDAFNEVMAIGGSVMDLIRALRDRLVDLVYRPLDVLVRTEVQRAATQAALDAYRQQSTVLRTLMWVATLDDRVCDYCTSLHGTVYYFDPGMSPNVNDIPPQPAHPRCRCTLVAGVANILGMNVEDVTPAQQRRIDGRVASSPRYPEWFARQKVYVQERIMGPSRYASYLAGKLKVKSVWTALPRNLVPIAPEDLSTLLRME